MRVLLVGAGRWGEKHLRVLRELGAEVWVADPDPARRALAIGAGVAAGRVLADFQCALPLVEAVDVVTPADSHLALATAALEAGKACFVEKPLAPTAAEGEGLARVVARTRGLLQVGHIFRVHPVTDILLEHLKAGALGQIRYATVRFAGFKRPRRDVGVTLADALHGFDLLAYLLPGAPTAVTATLRDHLGRAMDDCSFSAVECGPVVGFVEAGYFAPPTTRQITIVGDVATLVGDFAAAEVRLHANRHVHGAGGWEAHEGAVTAMKAAGPEPLRRELELFLDAAVKRRPPAVDVQAGILALRVAEAAERSSRLGRRVLVSEIGVSAIVTAEAAGG